MIENNIKASVLENEESENVTSSVDQNEGELLLKYMKFVLTLKNVSII